MRRKTNASKQEKMEMVRQYEAGISIHQLAEQYRLDKETVRRAIRLQGIEIPPPKIISNAQKSFIAKAHQQGLSTREIAIKSGVSSSETYKIIIEMGGTFKHVKNILMPHKETVIKQYQAGDSLTKISKRYGVTSDTVGYLLKREGVTIRNQKETTKKNWQNPDYAHAVNSKRVIQRGEMSHRWKGGKTALAKSIRTCAQYRQWRKSVFIRDNFTCQHCNTPSAQLPRYGLEADHIHPFCKILDENCLTTIEQALACTILWDINNGRTLCRECHKQTETHALNLNHRRRKTD